jgi:hypothetical protein
MTDPAVPAAKSQVRDRSAQRDRSLQRLLRVATWGQTLVQEATDARGARLVHEIAVRPGAIDAALTLADAWRAFAHPTLHPLTQGTVAQPAGSPGQVLRLERPLPRGTPLTQVLQKAPLDELAVAALFLDMAKGLVELHGVGLTAGNVSAETLLLCPPGQDEAAPLLLVDAGMPALVVAASGPMGEGGQARFGNLMPAMEGIAPEVLAGQTPTPAADAFALCVVMAEALLGHPLFAGPTAAALRATMASGLPANVLEPLHAAAPHLSAILQRGLSPQPWARAGALGELVDALTALCAGLPTTFADDRQVLAPWAPGSPLIALAAYASAVPWSAQFPESALQSNQSVASTADAEGQFRLRAALDQLDLERRRGQRESETAGRNVLSRLIIVGLFALIAAAIAASAVRQANRAKEAMHSPPSRGPTTPPPLEPMPKPRVIFETPRPE